MFVFMSDIFPCVASNSLGADHFPHALRIDTKDFHGTIILHLPKYTVTIHFAKYEAGIVGQIHFSLLYCLHRRRSTAENT